MMILNFSLVALFWFISYWAKKKSVAFGKIATTALMCIIAVNFILLLSLRTTAVGIDTMSYNGRFNYYKSASLSEIINGSQEIGFSLLMRLVGLLTNSFQWFLFSVAVLSVVPTFYIITKYSKLPFLSVILFIAFENFAFMFSGLRQAVAYSFCLFSYKYIREKNWFPFLICVIVAGFFHKSAYFFLPAYFLAKMRPNVVTYISLGIAFILVSVFRDPLYNFVQSAIYRHWSFAATDTHSFLWPLIITTIGVVTLVFAKNIINKDPDDGSLVFLMAVGTILIVFSMIGTNAKRLIEYYTIFLIFTIPCIIESLSSQTVRTIVLIGVLVGACGMFAFSVITDLYCLIPYYSVI